MSEQTKDQPIVFANQQAFEDAVLKIIQERLVIRNQEETKGYGRDSYKEHNITLEIRGQNEETSRPFSSTDLCVKI